MTHEECSLLEVGDWVRYTKPVAHAVPSDAPAWYIQAAAAKARTPYFKLFIQQIERIQKRRDGSLRIWLKEPPRGELTSNSSLGCTSWFLSANAADWSLYERKVKRADDLEDTAYNT